MDLKVSGANDIARALDAAIDSVRRRASETVQYTATQCVVKSKHDAPWTDRTGNARRSIHQESADNGMSALVGIGAFYGKYLELSHGGKYRVIHPTVFNYGRIVLIKNLRRIL